MVRQRHIRGIRVLVECGHEVVLPTSWFRLTASLVAVIVNHAVRGGTWCKTCRAFCQPEKVIGTCRLDSAPTEPGKPREKA